MGFASQIEDNSTQIAYASLGLEAGFAVIKSLDAFGNVAASKEPATVYAMLCGNKPYVPCEKEYEEDASSDNDQIDKIPSLLRGITELEFDNGIIKFDNLIVQETGIYRIKFCLESRFICPIYLVSNQFRIVSLDKIRIDIQPSNANAGSSIQPLIIDPRQYENSEAPWPKGPSVRSLDRLGKPMAVLLPFVANVFGDNTGYLLKGKTLEMSSNGLAEFTNLIIEKAGEYKIEFKPNIPGVRLSEITQTFVITTSLKSESCPMARDCILNIVQPPHPFWCDGLDRDPEDFQLPRDIAVGNCFRTFINVSDEYGNVLKFGNISAEIRLDGFVEPSNATWRTHLLQRRTLKFIADAQAGVLSFIFNISRSCTRADCANQTQTGYVIRFKKGNSKVDSPVFEIFPDSATSFSFDIMNWNPRTKIDEIYAGQTIAPGPTYFLYDKFGNLATTQQGSFIWNMTYIGPGCMFCDKQVVSRLGIGGGECKLMRNSAGQVVGRTIDAMHSLSTCTDLVEAKNGRLQINVSAPTLVVRGVPYKFIVELKSWDFGENNLFTGFATRNFSLLAGKPTAALIYNKSSLSRPYAGEIIDIPIAVTDKFGNIGTTGCMKTSLRSISAKSLIQTCLGCKFPEFRYCDDCPYEVKENPGYDDKKSEPQASHVGMISAVVSKSGTLDYMISVDFFNSCTSTQVILTLQTDLFSIRPGKASSVVFLEKRSRMEAGSMQMFSIELWDEFNNTAVDFFLVAEFTSKLTNGTDNCLYCDVVQFSQCSNMCISTAEFAEGSSNLFVRIPSKKELQIKLDMTAKLPAYEGWPPLSINFALDTFEIIASVPAKFEFVSIATDVSWLSLHVARFGTFPIVLARDRYNNNVTSGFKIALEVLGCGKDSHVEYIPHVWVPFEEIENLRKAPSYAYTDEHGIVEFRNFTVQYFNKNQIARCELRFKSLGPGTSALGNMYFNATPPVYPDGDPNFCPCIDPFNYSRRLTLHGIPVPYNTSNCAWQKKNGDCYPANYGVSAPKFTGRCTPADLFYNPQCQESEPTNLCTEPWCWVDPFKCQTDFYKSTLDTEFAHKMELPNGYQSVGSVEDEKLRSLWWSQATCGSESIVVEGTETHTIQVESQPLSFAEAGNPFAVQHKVILLNKNKIVVKNEEYIILASLCRPCPCPCEEQDVALVVDKDKCESVEEPVLVENMWKNISVWKGVATGCYVDEPYIVNNRATTKDGYANFVGLRSLRAGNNCYLNFSIDAVVGADDIGNAQRPMTSVSTTKFEVKACTLRSLKLSSDSFFPDLSDTGSSFCAGKPCIVELFDAFNNSVQDELEISASLEVMPDQEMAGIKVSKNCKCTGSNRGPRGAVGTRDQLVNTSLGAFSIGDHTLFLSSDGTSNYGTYCARWDSSGKDCSALWPKCTAGKWCCHAWCYVDKSCPGAVEDVLVEGLYLSYDACSSDPFLEMTCKYELPGECAARSPPSYSTANKFNNFGLPVSPPQKLEGKTSIVTSSGRAVFTDLSTSIPGKYSLIFQARWGADILQVIIQNIGVTPLFARKMRFEQDITSTTVSAFPDLQPPLESQPVLLLLDGYDNLVLNERICTAVTASVYPDSSSLIYGQSLNDTNSYCRPVLNLTTKEHRGKCSITTNIVNARASYSALSIPVRGGESRQIEFTTGCCDPEPDNCYCADPVNPLRADRSYAQLTADGSLSDRVREPCVRNYSSEFILIAASPDLEGLTLMFLGAPRNTYVAGEQIQARLALAKKGVILQGVFFTVVTYLMSPNADSPSELVLDNSLPQEYMLCNAGIAIQCRNCTLCRAGSSKVLRYERKVVSENSVASFDDLTVTQLKKQEYRFRLSFEVILKGTLIVTRSSILEIMPSTPVRMEVSNLPNGNSITTSLPYSATVKVFDKYDNAAVVNGKATLTLLDKKFANGANASRNPFQGATSIPFEGSEVTFNSSIPGDDTSIYFVVTGTYRFRITVSFFSDNFISPLSKDLDVLVKPGDRSTMQLKFIKFPDELTAWEPFEMDFMMLDKFGNLYYDLNPGMQVDVKVFTTPNNYMIQRSLSDSNVKASDECHVEPEGGVVRFRECRPVTDLQVAASSYLTLQTVELSIVFQLGSGLPAVTIAKPVKIGPPVISLETDICVSRQNCDRYWPVSYSLQPKVCNCTPSMVLKNGQLEEGIRYEAEQMLEPFFHFPRVRLLDSTRNLAQASQMPVRVRISEGTSCFQLMGKTTVYAVNGSAEFDQLGIEYNADLEECDPGQKSSAFSSPVSLIFEASHLDVGMEQSFVIHPSPSRVTVSISNSSAELNIVSEIFDGVAGVPFRRPLEVLIHKTGRPDQIITHSTRQFEVKAFRVNLRVNFTLADELDIIGTRKGPLVWGRGIISDASILSPGPFVIMVTSTSFEGMRLNRSTTLKPILSEVKFISANEFHHLDFQKQPATAISKEFIPVSVLMKDKYENSIGCAFGDCPKTIPRVQSEFDIQKLALHPQSSMIFQARVLGINGSLTSCTHFSSFPQCGCTIGTLRAATGVINSECFTVGRAGFNYSIQIFASGKWIVSQPFDILAGEIAILNIVRQPPETSEAGISLRTLSEGGQWSGIIVQILDSCRNNIDDPSNNVWIYASADPIESLMYPRSEMAQYSKQGKAEFGDLRISIQGPVKIFFHACPSDFREDPIVPFPYTDRVSTMCSHENGWVSNNTRTVTIVNNGAVGSLVITRQPSTAVQGQVFISQPQLELVDFFGNQLKTLTENTYVRAVLSSVGGCPAGPCDSICDGSPMRGKCYKFFDEAMTLLAADVECAKWGGFLATISDAAENQHVGRLSNGRPAWIGLVRNPISKLWFWLEELADNDGMGGDSLLDDTRATIYQNFLEWEKTNTGECAIIHAGDSGDFNQWGPRRCSTPFPFVCSKRTLTQASKCQCCQRLLGQTTVEVKDRRATFTDLFTFAAPGRTLQIHFTAFTKSSGIRADTSLMTTSRSFAIYHRASLLSIEERPGRGTSGQPLLDQPGIRMMDAYWQIVTQDVLVVEAMLLFRRSDLNESECSCNSICMNDCYPTSLPTESQIENTNVPLLVGNIFLQSNKVGHVRFTDLAVVRPKNLTWGWDLRLRFAAKTGTIGYQNVIYSDSDIFPVSQWAYRLVLLEPKNISGSIGRYLAGDGLPTFKIEMQDSQGKPIVNSNIDLIVGLSPEMSVPNPDDYLFMSSCEAVGTTCFEKIKGGYALFTDLKVTWVSENVRIFFFTAKFPGTPVPLTLTTESFVVHAGKFSRVKFVTQPHPQQLGAGKIFADVTVAAVDDFGNIDPEATGYHIIIGVDECINATTCSLGRKVTDKGVVVFEGLKVNASGVHTFKSRLVSQNLSFYDIDMCFHDFQLQVVDVSRRKWICQERSTRVAISSEFDILPEVPYVLDIVHDIVSRHVAGKPFAAPPLVTVKDRYGNLVRDVFHVVATVADELGRGCICDYSRSLYGALCLDSDREFSVQICNGDCPDRKLQRRASVTTVNGLANFSGLACTRASCSPECNSPTCEESNCKNINRFRMSFTLPGCTTCLSRSREFDVYPGDFTSIFAEPVDFVIAGTPEYGMEESGFFSVLPSRPYIPTRIPGASGFIPPRSAAHKYLKDLTPFPPSIRIIDSYGNVNATVQGRARVSLAMGKSPDIAGYFFCSDPGRSGLATKSRQGTICLSGTFTAEVKNGYGDFTNLFIRHAGPGWTLQFMFQHVTMLGDMFHAFPSPPKLSGVVFSENFASIIFNFDAPTNRGNMQGGFDCDKVLSKTAIANLGKDPKCTWDNDYQMVAKLGSGASVTGMDELEINRQAVIFTCSHYTPIIQSAGMPAYSQVQEPHPAGLSLCSPRLKPISEAVMNPEKMMPYQRLSSLPAEIVARNQPGFKAKCADALSSYCDPATGYVIGSAKSKFDEVTSSGAAYFEIEVDDSIRSFVAIANYCGGKNCWHNSNAKFTSGETDIDSAIYKWNDDGTFTFYQTIPTQGAMEVKPFVAQDKREDGPIGPKQFLIFANYYTKNKDPAFCLQPTSCTANLTIWEYDYGTHRFSLRQVIDTVQYGTAVDVHRNKEDLILVITTTVVYDQVQVYRWVDGSFRIDEIYGWLYKWPVDQIFGWVPGLFSEFVQVLPSSSPSDVHLYHAGDRFCLAIANYAVDSGSTQSTVDIYAWDANGCKGTLLGGCFEFFTRVPALGPTSVATLDSRAPGGKERHFLVVANGFEGDVDNEVPDHSMRNSYVYMIDYQTGTYERIQAIRSSGARSVKVFQFCDSCRKLLAIANMKGIGGLAVNSKIYEFNEATATCANSTANCSISPIPQFKELIGLPTVGAVDVFHAYNTRGQRSYILSAESNGLVGLKIFSVADVVPNPRIVSDYNSFLGPCDPLQIDLQSSMNSGGRDFISEWRLDLFDPADRKKTKCRDVGREDIDEFEKCIDGCADFDSKSCVDNCNTKKGSCVSPAIVGVIKGAAIFYNILIPAERGSTLPDQKFLPAGTYVLSVHMTNWMGGVAEEKIMFDRSVMPVPLAKIAGETFPPPFKVSQEISLVGIATPSKCEGSDPTGLAFQWTINPMVPGFSEKWGSGNRIFVIPPNALTANRTYKVTFNAIQGRSSAMASVKVTTTATLPVAKLTGSDRLVSLAKPATFILDASSSFSPDEAPVLQYAWECGKNTKYMDKDIGYVPFDCNMVTTTSVSSNSKSIGIDALKLRAETMKFAPETGMLTFTEGCLPNNVVRCDPAAKFFFTVTVCNPGDIRTCQRGVDMSSSVTVAWSTTPQNPDISVSIAPLNRFRISSVYGLALLGSSNLRSLNVSYKWVQMRSDYDLLQPKATLTPISSNVLVVRTGVLKGAQTFTFRLYASLERSLQNIFRSPDSSQAAYISQFQNCLDCSWAEVTLDGNLEPTSGQLAVDPMVGLALQTKYSFLAQEWVDPPVPQEDYPLTYSFGYKGKDNITKYLIVDSLLSSYTGILPTGNIMCSSGGFCRKLEVVLEVADALDARAVRDGLFVRADQHDPSRMEPLLSSIKQDLVKLVKNQDGLQILSTVGTGADCLNDPSIPFEEIKLNLKWKASIRQDFAISLNLAVEKLLQPMTMSLTVHVLSVLASLCTKSREITGKMSEMASSMINIIANEVLRRQRLGQGVPRMDEAAYYLDLISEQSSIASYLASKAAPENRRRTSVGPTPESIQGMDVIKTMILTSQIKINAHQETQQPVESATDSFRSITRRIESYEFRDVASLRALTEIRISFNASQIYKTGSFPDVNPAAGELTATVQIPDPNIYFDRYQQSMSAYEVQTAVLYVNTLPESQAYTVCMDPKQYKDWNSGSVLTPKDNFGGLEYKYLRSGIRKHYLRSCKLVGQTYLFEVRAFGQDVVVNDFGGKHVKLRLPFNPWVQPTVLPTDLFADEFTGVGSAASCLYWDKDTHAWSSEGIQHINAYYGDANGLGAYVDCLSPRLGIFAVSEVWLDCTGAPSGVKIRDWCGVCGGDNSSCSGCDGFPLSGRSKECSGHGRCKGMKPVQENTCQCEKNYYGIICQIYCNPAINCSGHGQCYANYEGLSMNTSVGCYCEPGWRMTWERGYLECFKPFEIDYKYEMPWPLFYFLVIGMPVIAIICCVVCILSCLTTRQVVISKKLQTDITGFVEDYEQANGDFAIENTEINADLCMPIIVFPPDGEDEKPKEHGKHGHGFYGALKVNDQEHGRSQRNPDSEGVDGNNSDNLIGEPSRLLRIMAGLDDAGGADAGNEDWRKYLVNTSLSRRLKAVQDAQRMGPRGNLLGATLEDEPEGEHGDEVAV